MDNLKLKALLQKIRDRELDINDALEEFRHFPFEDLDFVKIDHHRSLRKGLPEVVLAPGKTVEQLNGILDAIATNSEPTLITRLSEPVYQALTIPAGDFHYHRQAEILSLNLAEKAGHEGSAVILSAGTSDHKAAAEARLTLRAFGFEAPLIQDVGVAGIHRLFAQLPVLFEADVIIVVAGMDGALPSVVGGLVNAPVIAVPTSTGYGASLGGISALLSMVNSCASGVTVVNIDNGFGAAYSAGLMLKKLHA